MNEIAVILGGTGFVLALISVLGLIWCIGEVQGWKKTKMKIVYNHPNLPTEGPIEEAQRLNSWEQMMNPNHNAAPLQDIDLTSDEEN